ncbi:MAG: HAD-IC family P-type ATPase [Myxococcota bacterium]
MTTAGLTEQQVAERRARWGPNALPAEVERPWRDFARRFWAPIPWLLEATIALQLFLAEYVEAAVIGVLLVANAVIGLVQERRAKTSLRALEAQLAVTVRVHRDGAWVSRPAADLVPDDLVELEQGALVPADVELLDGRLDVDLSALTGESQAVGFGPGGRLGAGGIVRTGAAHAKVVAIGSHTAWGRTAELVRTARPVNHQEAEISRVVRDLFVINLALVTLLVGVAHQRGLALPEVLPLVLTLLLAAIPVALPATFTLAAALGAVELSRRGAVVTRLSAIHDLAAMGVLCTDKTGTLTRNEATVQRSLEAGASPSELLDAAALASDAESRDAIERALADQRAPHPGWERTAFKPFQAESHWSEATWRDARGALRVFLKGAPDEVARLCADDAPRVRSHVEALAADGLRVIAVAAGAPGGLRYLGALGLADEVRPDSSSVVAALRARGVRVVMVTGDTLVTAAKVAREVGLEGDVAPAERLREGGAVLERVAGFAVVRPEDKIRLVRALQGGGLVVGMSGDGVNDAPALRQAEAGFAVSNATDVARAAAAIVLTRPGLGALPEAVEISRRVFQRIVTYTLNSLSKKVELMLLLATSFLLFGTRPLTPLLMVLVMFLNDFVTMSLTSDGMSVAPRPTPWTSSAITAAAIGFGLARLLLSLSALVFVPRWFHLDAAQTRLMTFLLVVASSQAGLYSLRERGAFWASRPGRALLISSAFALTAAVVLAASGVLGASLSSGLALGLVGASFAFFAVLDPLKVVLFRALHFR